MPVLCFLKSGALNSRAWLGLAFLLLVCECALPQGLLCCPGHIEWIPTLWTSPWRRCLGNTKTLGSVMGWKEDLTCRGCESRQDRNVLAWTKWVTNSSIFRAGLAAGPCESRCPPQEGVQGSDYVKSQEQVQGYRRHCAILIRSLDWPFSQVAVDSTSSSAINYFLWPWQSWRTLRAHLLFLHPSIGVWMSNLATLVSVAS